MPGHFFGEEPEPPDPKVGPLDYAKGGYTSCPSEPAIEPEGADPADEPVSNPYKFEVEATFDTLPDDIAAFDATQAERRAVFMDRREKYGSHLNNAVRFPLENIAGLYLKCVRLIRMIEANYNFAVPLDEDTLIDNSNYSDMVKGQ